MFTRPTVFILGAGASWHYGYPTGPELIEQIKERAEDFLRALEDFQRLNVTDIRNSPDYCPTYILDKITENKSYPHAIVETINECQSLVNRINEVDPLVIDYFLNHNLDLKDIGTLLISSMILHWEKQGQKRGNWCRFLLHNMMMGCEKPEDFLKNDVYFITFNYDVSLEQNLSQGLKKNHFFNNTNIVEKFLTPERILHVYGKAQSPVASQPDGGLNYNANEINKLKKWKYILDPAYIASKGIYTIAPGNKLNDQDTLKEAKKKIDRAESIYILGYGFDRLNSENIGLDKALHHLTIRNIAFPKNSNNPKKAVYFTNKDNKNLVSKRASELFYKKQNAFLPPNTLISMDENAGAHYEMSIKSVYEALDEDFEFLD